MKDLNGNPRPSAFQSMGGGECGALARSHDWSATPLGPLDAWPQIRKTAVGIVLQSAVPMVTLWGPEGVMLYNDAYAVFAGARHPELFGSKVREGWTEAADFNDNVMKVCLAGGTLAYRDREMTLTRAGYPAPLWVNLDYSPILDEDGAPVGVIAIVVETTDRVLADRRIADEHARLSRMFEQAPSFMAMLAGEGFVFEMVNPDFHRLIGRRPLVGRPVLEALPELAGQGFIELLEQARASGEAIRRIGMKVSLGRADGARVEDRFVDFVYQPIRDHAGAVTHIFVQGVDVTDRVRAERQQRLLIDEMNHRVKNTLATVQAIINQTLRGAATVEAASNSLGERIQALARAQDLLTAESWSGADVAAVVRAAVGVHGGAARFDVRGPKLRIGSRAALALALALHELGTNATKYGALASPAGRVAVTWRIDRSSGGRSFALDWRETGGPEITAPGRGGFGSKLIQRGLAAETGGTVVLDFAPTGLQMSLRASLATVTEGA